MSNSTAKIVLAASTFLLATMPINANADCIRRVVTSEAYADYSSGEAKALQIAISAWSSNVKAVASSDYSSWAKAEQKNTSCALSGNKKYYTCKVSAVPCK